MTSHIIAMDNCYTMYILLLVLQASKVQITPNQADIKFPDGNGDLFTNATFSASDASIVIPGALLLERGKNGTNESNILHISQKIY